MLFNYLADTVVRSGWAVFKAKVEIEIFHVIHQVLLWFFTIFDFVTVYWILLFFIWVYWGLSSLFTVCVYIF